MSGMRVRVKAEHGQFYASAYGPDVDRLKGRPRLWFWRPAVVGVGATRAAALVDLAGLIRALEKSAAPPGGDKR